MKCLRLPQLLSQGPQGQRPSLEGPHPCFPLSGLSLPSCPIFLPGSEPSFFSPSTNEAREQLGGQGGSQDDPSSNSGHTEESLPVLSTKGTLLSSQASTLVLEFPQLMFFRWVIWC